MGNSIWRLQTTINLTSYYAAIAGVAEEVEIIVVDWGSEVALSKILTLSPAASRMVRFIHVPAEVAIANSEDSKFPEVRALNVAVRRAKGLYIGRVDNDTVTGMEFFKAWGNLIEGKSDLRAQPEACVMFVRRRCVPYVFVSASPSLSQVHGLLWKWGKSLEIEKLYPFYKSAVGIIVMHRDLWFRCTGYDEKMIYWGWMEVDLVERLMKYAQVPCFDLGDMLGVHFYHLEHYDPSRPRETNRRWNPTVVGPKLAANSNSWGLAEVYFLNCATEGLVSAAMSPTHSYAMISFAGIMARVRCGHVKAYLRAIWRSLVPVMIRNYFACVRRRILGAQ